MRDEGNRTPTNPAAVPETPPAPPVPDGDGGQSAMPPMPGARRRRADRHAQPPAPYTPDYLDTVAIPVFRDARKAEEARRENGPAPRRKFSRRAAWLLALAAVVALLIPIGVGRYRAWQAERAQAARVAAWEAEGAEYRLEFRDLIERYAAQQALPPALVAAVIYNESRFNPQAVSNMDAHGLMQIRPDTGDWIAYRLGETETYRWEDLFDPEMNIRYGTWFLGYLGRTHGLDIAVIAAGYHAGQGRVAEWLANPAYSKNGVTLDVIPYPDTEQYVRKVVAAYEIYTRHYYAPQGEEQGAV